LLKEIVHRAAHFEVNIVLQPAHLLSLQVAGYRSRRWVSVGAFILERVVESVDIVRDNAARYSM
jgi:hypothetical protein